ncbi:MAG TPA: hypothetical protein VN950_11555 [Terriglobales bacterium]|nr:hypothetical protein [Terriglobales bacterium]
MNRKLWKVFAGLCVLAMSAVWAMPVSAQMSEVKEKPPMYSYVAFWTLPRAEWADMAKSNIANAKILDKAVANGTIVGYGNDENLIHAADAPTHDGWWSAMSMAGVLNVLDQFYKAGNPTSPVLASATNHWDNIYVSRYYNWHSGSWKDLYTHGSSYKLRPDAPSNAVETLSKTLVVPLLEKMLADDTIHEYEIDIEAVHTQAPGTFWIFYMAANAEALDKVDTALRDTLKANPLDGPAFSSMTDFTEHRDYLVRTAATYK